MIRPAVTTTRTTTTIRASSSSGKYSILNLPLLKKTIPHSHKQERHIP